jgi:hypothetical protein
MTTMQVSLLKKWALLHSCTLRFKASEAPGFWMHETSGVLRPAIEAYLHGELMTGKQIAAMRAYLRQWINAPEWDQNPHAGHEDRAWLASMRLACDALLSRAAIALWIDQATEQGMDPL